MCRIGPKRTILLFAILILQSASPVFSQAAKELHAGKWANDLDKTGIGGNKELEKLNSLLSLHKAESQGSAETSGFALLDSPKCPKDIVSRPGSIA